MAAASHSQRNGLCKRMNRTLTADLRAYANVAQVNWDTEFTYGHILYQHCPARDHEVHSVRACIWAARSLTTRSQFYLASSFSRNQKRIVTIPVLMTEDTLRTDREIL